MFHFLASPSWQWQYHSSSHTSDWFALIIFKINLTDKQNIAFEIRKPLEYNCIILYHSLGMGKAFSICQDSSKTLIEQRLMWWSFSGEDWEERAFLFLQHMVPSGHKGHGVFWIPSMPCLSESISFHRSCWALSSCVTSSLIHTCFWHLCCPAWSLNALLTTLHFYYYLNHCFSFYAFKILLGTKSVLSVAESHCPYCPEEQWITPRYFTC